MVEFHHGQTAESATPTLPNRKILIEGTYLEINCERQVLFAYPSFHKGGNRYEPINNETIAELNYMQLTVLQVQIDTLCEGYMSDEDRTKYIEYLHLPTTILDFITNCKLVVSEYLN